MSSKELSTLQVVYFPCLTSYTSSLYNIAKSQNKLVQDEIEEIAQSLESLNPDLGVDYKNMTQEEIVTLIDEQRKKNSDFEEYLRQNFTMITDKKKKDLARFEIDKIIEKYKD